MRTNELTMAVLIAAVLLCGCAKTPLTAVTSVPSPTGVAGTTTDAKSTPAVSSTGSTVSPAQPTGSTTTGRPTPSEFVAVREVEDIHFDFDKYVIRSEAGATLARNARWLKANEKDLLLIEGHCDERGTGEYNLALGERRAKATMTYLVDQGVAARRITTISYGKERPQCTDHQEACWAKNRRAHFLVKHG
jgi:peptidoglycan-associated lipoprotein